MFNVSLLIIFLGNVNEARKSKGTWKSSYDFLILLSLSYLHSSQKKSTHTHTSTHKSSLIQCGTFWICLFVFTVRLSYRLINFTITIVLFKKKVVCVTCRIFFSQEQRQNALLEVEKNIREQQEYELELQSALKIHKRKVKKNSYIFFSDIKIDSERPFYSTKAAG